MPRPAPAAGRFVRALLATALTPCVALAQGRGGDVRGTVTSAESGAPLAGARVAVTSPARAALTSERGGYVLRDLPAGRYEIVVTALGRRASRDSVSVAAGASTPLD